MELPLLAARAWPQSGARSGVTVKVKPKRLPFFKVGKELKERVNASAAAPAVSRAGNGAAGSGAAGNGAAGNGGGTARAPAKRAPTNGAPGSDGISAAA